MLLTHIACTSYLIDEFTHTIKCMAFSEEKSLEHVFNVAFTALAVCYLFFSWLLSTLWDTNYLLYTLYKWDIRGPMLTCFFCVLSRYCWRISAETFFEMQLCFWENLFLSFVYVSLWGLSND